MAATVGPAPWDKDAYSAFAAGYKRLNARDRQRLGVEHSLSSGYRTVQGGGSRQESLPYTKTVTLYNGRKVEVSDADYEDFLGFHKIADDEQGAMEIANYIDKAFPEGKASDEVEGAGHIKLLKYSARYTLMWVDFESDTYSASVVYFRVPKEVYSELRSYALSKQVQISPKDGKERHVLGIKFWDYVRIRGTVHGSRYRFKYTKDNTATEAHAENIANVKAARTAAAEQAEQKAKPVAKIETDNEVWNRIKDDVQDEYKVMVRDIRIKQVTTDKNARRIAKERLVMRERNKDGKG